MAAVTSFGPAAERSGVLGKLREVDWGFCALLAIIGAIGALILYSAAGNSWDPWADNHLIRFAGCFVILLVLATLNLRVWHSLAYPVYVVGVLLLVAVEVLGHTALGAQRWLKLGPLTLQPSEIVKIGLVLALARYYQGLSAKEARWSWKLAVPAMLIGVPTVLIAHQPDLGTALLTAFTGAAIMFLAGLTWRVIVPAMVAAGVAVPVFVEFVLKEYQRNRVLTFLHPEQDPGGTGYHIMQSKIALGSGGLLGKGYGLGTQSALNFLPEKHTDFIFSTLAEQFGFVGSVVVLALYAAVIFSALRTAFLSHSHFGRLCAAGVTATFSLYILINAAMVMGLAPVVGVPMPLLSYGGTVMVTVMIGFGLVQAVRVHRYTEIVGGRTGLPWAKRKDRVEAETP